MQVKSDRNGLSFESLEDRRLLAQTPQLLSDLSFRLTGTEAQESISPFFEINDLLVARTNHGGLDCCGRLEVFRPTDSQQWDIEIPTQQPESMVEFNDELFLLFERHRTQAGQGGPERLPWVPKQEAWGASWQSTPLLSLTCKV